MKQKAPSKKNIAAEQHGATQPSAENYASVDYRQKAEELQKQNTALLQEIQNLISAKGKTAEEILRDSEKKYQAIVEHSSELFYSHTPEHVLTYVSPQSRTILGCEPEEALVKWTEFVTSNPVNAVGIESTQRAIDTGVAQPPYELEIKTRDGRIIWAEVHESPVVSEGRTTAIVGALLDITEKKKSLESLRLSEEMYRLLAEHMRDVVWFLDIPTLQFTYVSPSAKSLLGYSPAEVMKLSLQDILTEKSYSYVMGLLRDVLRRPKGSLEVQEFPLREVEQVRKDGTVIWTEISTSFLCDKEKNPTSIVGVSRDIQARKSAENKFAENEERLRLLINSTPDIICFKDGAGCWLQANESILELFNLPVDAYREKGGDELLRLSGTAYSDAYSQCFLTDEQAWNTQHMTRVEETIPDRTGKIHDFDVIKIPLFNPDGTRRGLIVHGREVTERIETEKRMKFINDRLDLISRVVSSVVSSSPVEEQVQQHIELVREAFNIDVIILRALEGNELVLVTSTGVAKELLARSIRAGWGISKIICETKQPLTIFDMAENPATRDYRFLIPGTYEGKSYAGAPLLIENRITGILGVYTTDTNREFSQTDLEHLQIIANHIAIVLENNKLYKSIEEKRMLLEKELAERKAIEAELIHAKERAEDANRLKTSILANMSHELRTPLIGILGYSELLADEVDSNGHKKMAETILRSGQRLLNTLNLVLDFSRIEANRFELDISELDVGESVREGIQLFADSARAKGLEFRLEIKNPGMRARLDSHVLGGILNNLVDNAIKFTESGSVTVTVEKEQNGGFAGIHVKDTGIGMSAESLAIVFAEFRQASEGMSRAYEGTGLGLTLTKKMTELLGGSISAESKFGSGSRFSVRFPLVQSDEIAAGVQRGSEISAKKNDPPAILIVDDDPVTCNVMRFMIAKLAPIDIAADANEARAKLPGGNYSMVFLDINLGSSGSGLDVLAEIRQMHEYDSIPIIALTAYAMAGDDEKFIQAGCSHYLSKPFTKAALVGLVTQLLQEAKS